MGGGAFGGNQLESLLLQFFGHLHQGSFVAVMGGEKHGAFGGQHFPSRQLSFGVGHAERAGCAHHFAGGAHLRAQHRV